MFCCGLLPCRNTLGELSISNSRKAAAMGLREVGVQIELRRYILGMSGRCFPWGAVTSLRAACDEYSMRYRGTIMMVDMEKIRGKHTNNTRGLDPLFLVLTWVNDDQT